MSKTGLPEDHDRVIKGVYHGDNADEPFDDGDDGCSSSNCHQGNLRGGIGEVDDKHVIAPSCFQCHGKLWEGRGNHD